MFLPAQFVHINVFRALLILINFEQNKGFQQRSLKGQRKELTKPRGLKKAEADISKHLFRNFDHT